MNIRELRYKRNDVLTVIKRGVKPCARDVYIKAIAWRSTTADSTAVGGYYTLLLVWYLGTLIV